MCGWYFRVRRLTAFYIEALFMTSNWGAISGSFSVASLLLGLVLGAVALQLVRGHEIPFDIRMRPIKVVILTLNFLYELVMSALRMAVLVLSPRMELRPGIFAYRLRANTAAYAAGYRLCRNSLCDEMGDKFTLGKK